MEFEDLFVRSSLAGQSIAVILRPIQEFTPTDDVVVHWQELLSRTSPDQSHSVTRLSASWLSDELPARMGKVRLRTLVVPQPSAGEALSSALRERTEPIVVWAERESVPSDEEWKELLSRLEHGDIVSLRRASSGQAMVAWPIEKLVRGILGISFVDPLSPIKVMRREAIASITFQMEGAGVHLELAAKGTYLVRLIDEVPTRERRPSWLWALASIGLFRFLLHPLLTLAPIPESAKPGVVEKSWMPMYSGGVRLSCRPRRTSWGCRATPMFPAR